jgi:hypothetical protein
MTDKQTTTYVVLEQQESAGPAEAGERQANIYWVEREQIEARAATDAIRSYVNANGITKGGIFYAVPLRSWRPITVAVETQTRLKLS